MATWMRFTNRIRPYYHAITGVALPSVVGLKKNFISGGFIRPDFSGYTVLQELVARSHTFALIDVSFSVVEADMSVKSYFNTPKENLILRLSEFNPIEISEKDIISEIGKIFNDTGSLIVNPDGTVS